jgi:DNA-binding response OmpR family regulator
VLDILLPGMDGWAV